MRTSILVSLVILLDNYSGLVIIIIIVLFSCFFLNELA